MQPIGCLVINDNYFCRSNDNYNCRLPHQRCYLPPCGEGGRARMVTDEVDRNYKQRSHNVPISSLRSTGQLDTERG